MHRLRYRSYLASGMVPANPRGTVTDRFDNLPNAMTFGVYLDGELASTIRLHHVTAKTPGSPSAAVFADLLEHRIAAGETFVDPSRFAADPDATAQFPYLPYLTLRLAAMASIFFKADYCLSTVRPDHAPFYRRVFNARQVAPLRPFPDLNYEVVLYQAHCRTTEDGMMARYPFFKSTPAEQRMMFGKPRAGEIAPLTILPTAHYYLQAA
ncbi:MAG: hypothetical protein WBF87_08245 [Mesorhizobium sp.]